MPQYVRQSDHTTTRGCIASATITCVFVEAKNVLLLYLNEKVRIVQMSVADCPWCVGGNVGV